MSEDARREHQKGRLETLADVVYGVTIVLLVSSLPTPASEGMPGVDLATFLAATYELIVSGTIALAMIVTYWIQHNAVTGILARTNGRHSTLSIVQLIVMLVYFYAGALSTELGHPASLLALQSATLASMGVIGMVALRHATGEARLVRDDVSPEELRRLRISLLPEPTTAAATLLVAPLGSEAWALAWLAYPIVHFGVNRVAGSRGG